MERMLSSEEVNVLTEVIREYLSDLRMEIAGTDDYDYRKGLKHKEDILQSVISRLEPGSSPQVN